MVSIDTDSEDWRTKAAHFLGFARVSLSQLDYKATASKKHDREECEKETSKLVNLFKLAGCRRYEEDNFIDAKIDSETFTAALRKAKLTPESFKCRMNSDLESPKRILKFQLDRKVTYIDGLHRVLAGQEYLDPNDKWWIVKLHASEGFNDEVSTRLFDSFAREQHFSDGTIFRNIRKHNKKGDEAGENWWLARLTDTKRKDLKQLLKNRELMKAFDLLIPFPGLWTPIQLGTLHRLHGLRCPEELVNYLEDIYVEWQRLVPERFRSHVDSQTVTEIELLAPGVSAADASRVEKLMKNKEIFPGVEYFHDRDDILTALKETKRLIPSLKSFFENQKYLEPCSLILKILLGESQKKYTLWNGFSANYFEPKEFSVQCTDNISRIVEMPSEYRKGLGYVELWMFCLRHFPEMTSISPKQAYRSRDKTGGKRKGENSVAVVEGKEYNSALWHKLGKLAVEKGFRTSPALELANQDPDRTQVSQFLRKARPTYRGDLRPHLEGAIGILEKMTDEDIPGPVRPVFSDVRSWPRDRRCGKPFDDDHLKDKESLFVSLFYEQDDNPKEPNFTSLFVKRDLFQVFFRSYIEKADSYMRPFVASLEHDLVRIDYHNSVPTRTYRSEVEQERERLQAQIDILNGDLTTKQKQVEELQAREMSVDRLQEELLHLNAKNVELRGQHEAHIDILNRDMDKKQKQIDQLQANQMSADELVKEISHLKTEIAELKGQNEASRGIENTLKAAQEENSTLRRTVQEFQSEQAQWNEDRIGLQSQLQESKLQQAADRDVEQSLAKERKENASLQTLIKQMESGNAQLLQERVGLQSDLKTIREQKITLESKQAELNKEKSDLQEKLSSVEAKCNLLCEESADLRKSLEECQRQRAILQTEFEKLTTDVKDKEAEQVAMQTEMANMKIIVERSPDERHFMALFSGSETIQHMMSILQKRADIDLSEDVSVIMEKQSAAAEHLEVTILVNLQGLHSCRLYIPQDRLKDFAYQLMIAMTSSKSLVMYVAVCQKIEDAVFLQKIVVGEPEKDITPDFLRSHEKNGRIFIGNSSDIPEFSKRLSFLDLKSRSRKRPRFFNTEYDIRLFPFRPDILPNEDSTETLGRQRKKFQAISKRSRVVYSETSPPENKG